nr:envelope membrane protein [Chlamydomonas sp. UWO 241]
MPKENKNQFFNRGWQSEPTKQESVSITYEEIGFFPRSFSRVLDRFLKQVFSDVENLVIQEYRFYRYLFLTTLKCLLILFIVPFLVNFFAKTYFVRPLTEYFWNTQQTEIFLNSYQQKRAFAELKNFEEKLYFESLILPSSKTLSSTSGTLKGLSENEIISSVTGLSASQSHSIDDSLVDDHSIRYTPLTGVSSGMPFLSNGSKTKDLNLERVRNENSKRDAFEQRLQEKTIELAIRFNNQSIEAITNFFADLLSFMTLCYLLFALEIQINITKSFLLEVFFGLDDSKKSLLILLITDLLVGYHSSNLWELFFEFLFTHYGLPESQTGIFLLVATLPVLLDVLFKYLIFRHLNRSSPATVATYHAMIE